MLMARCVRTYNTHAPSLLAQKHAILVNVSLLVVCTGLYIPRRTVLIGDTSKYLKSGKSGKKKKCAKKNQEIVDSSSKRPGTNDAKII